MTRHETHGEAPRSASPGGASGAENFDESLVVVTRVVAASDDVAAKTLWAELAGRLKGSLDGEIGQLQQDLDRTLADLRASVVARGLTSKGALSAVCRMKVALMCCGDADAADAARRTYDGWLAVSVRELGKDAAAELDLLAADLDFHRKFTEAAHALSRAVACSPDAATTRDLTRKLGVALARAGETEQALATLRELGDLLAKEEPRAELETRASYAGVLYDLGRYDDARDAYDDLAARAIAKPERVAARISAATASHRGGAEADGRARLFALVAELNTEGELATVLGVRATEELLAMLLPAQDEEAVTVQRALLAATEKAFAADHPRALREAHNLAAIYGELEARDEAEALLRAVLVKQIAAQGTQSADALRTRRTLARVLRWNDKAADAQSLQREIELLAPDDPLAFEAQRIHFRGDEPA